MIIRMRPDAGKILALRASDHFRAQGLRVFVENGRGRISLAVFNPDDDSDGHFPINGLAGIATTMGRNKYFFDNRANFVPSEEYFPG